MANSFNFLTSRGCVCYTGIGGISGIYQLGDLQQCMFAGAYGLILIDSVDISKVDAVTPKDALDDKHALYIYGKSFGQVTVQGTAYLGRADGEDAPAVIGEINNWFNSNRVSVTKEPVVLSIANQFKGDVYITKLRFGQAEPRLNTIKFTIEGFVKPD